MSDQSWGFSHLPEMDLHFDNDRREDSAMVKELYEAVHGCASTAVDFLSNLPTAAFSEFWYSCK